MAVKPKEERGHMRQLEHAGRDETGMRAVDQRAMSRVSLAEVRQLIALMETNDLSEIAIERPGNGMRLVLRRAVTVATSSAPTPVIGPAPSNPLMAVPVAPVAATAPTPERVHVTAPRVGIFYLAMHPTQKPLVAVGDVVREGQVVGAIETLNVMDEVEAEVAGRVVEILVKPGQPVEYGQPLIVLTPEA